MINVKYIMYTEKIAELVNDIKEIIKRLILVDTEKKYEKISNQFNSDLKTIEEKTNFKIALVGQYSAGKSTIIASLTNNMDIKRGQNITTDRVKEYKWGNIILVDTPGIATENQEHTEKAYKQMDLADLLIYVTTTQGFDNFIARDFKNIAFNRQKCNKMMLIVNKISLESLENKKNWERHIEQVIEPFKLEKFYTTFIDAEYYLDFLIEEDLKDRRELEELSGYIEFIEKINKFIEDKKINGRLISNLNIIDECALNLLDEATIGDESEKIKELLRQKKFLVSESKQNLEDNIEEKIDKLNMQIKLISNEVINKIGEGLDGKVLSFELKDCIERIKELCEKTGRNIENLIEVELDGLIVKINNLEKSAIYADVLNNKRQAEFGFDINLKEKKDFDKFKRLEGPLSDIGKFLGVSGKGFKNWCANANNSAKGMKAFSGSDAHKCVLKLGHLLGKKFKPYEAVKVAEKINKAGGAIAKVGKGVGIVGALMGPAIAICEEHQEAKFDSNVKEARKEMRDKFQILNDEIKENFSKVKKKIIEEIYDVEIKNIRLEIEKLRNKEKLRSNESKKIQEILNKTKKIIEDISET